MAADENLDFHLRNPTDPAISVEPWPLENRPGLKCYRNAILIWLFHTPLLLNWIDDNHEKHDGDLCPLCALRELARRFWARDRDYDTTFDQDVDKFWKQTHNPGLIDLNRQNDAEEYLDSLLGYIISTGANQWAPLIQVQKQCVKKCRECSFHTQDSAQDFEQGFFLQGTISRKDIEHQPLCHTLRFSKSEKAACNNAGCPSKKRKPTTDGDPRPLHDFFYGLRAAPPILAIHCKPYQFLVESANGEMVGHVSGKVTRLEHSLAVSSYPDRFLDPKTVNWTFYHLYGVILRKGDTDFTGHYVCAFEQPQTGRWLYFNDYIFNEDSDDYEPPEEGYEVNNDGRPSEVTVRCTRRGLDDKIEDMLKRDWRIFMVMYRKLFQVPVQLLTKITFPSSVIALQDQQSLEESGEPEPEPEESEAADDQEEFYTPEGEGVGDQDIFGFASDSEQTPSEPQGAADDEQPQGSPSELETRTEQPMQAGLPAERNVEVEANSLLDISSPSEPGQAERHIEIEANSLLDISSPSEPGQAEQPLPAERNIETEANSLLDISSPSEPGQAERHIEIEANSLLDISSPSEPGQAEQPLPAERNVEVEANSLLDISSPSEPGQAEQPSPTDISTEKGVEAEANPDSSTSTTAAGQTVGETQRVTDNVFERDTSDSKLQISQVQQPLPTELPVEQNAELEAYSLLDISSPSETGKAKQLLPTDLPTEQAVEVEAYPESSTTKPDTTNTGNRAQVEKSAQNEHRVKDENEQTTSLQSTSEIVRTEVEPSVQPRKQQAKGKATKRTHDKTLDEEEEKSTSVPAFKRVKTEEAKSSTQPKRKATESKATKKTKKDASDDHEDDKAEKLAPSTKRAEPVVELSTGYGGRETRSRARAKRGRDEIPDVDKVEIGQTATSSKPASKKAKTTRSAAPGKTQTKSKAQRKK